MEGARPLAQHAKLESIPPLRLHSLLSANQGAILARLVPQDMCLVLSLQNALHAKLEKSRIRLTLHRVCHARQAGTQATRDKRPAVSATRESSATPGRRFAQIVLQDGIVEAELTPATLAMLAQKVRVDRRFVPRVQVRIDWKWPCS